MLVVIAIIGILVALAVVTGTRVISAGKTRATQDVIRVLDESRAAWMLNWDKPMPEFLEVKGPSGKPQFHAMIDARLAASNDWSFEARPSLTLYTALVLPDPMISPIFQQLDPAFVKPTTVPRPDNQGGTNQHASRALTITDAWGRPIRFVHPAFHGGFGPFWDADSENMNSQRETLLVRTPTSKGVFITAEFRRSYRPFSADDPARKQNWVGDGDEGMCIGNTPYFYSAGEDGDPGTRADNAYSTEPRFPVETRDFE
jgi:type II secretory pathway pseudopilin PulG